jgi:hypothetical protein
MPDRGPVPGDLRAAPVLPRVREAAAGRHHPDGLDGDLPRPRSGRRLRALSIWSVASSGGSRFGARWFAIR